MAEVWTPPAFDDISTSELVTAAYLNGLGNSLRFIKEVNHVQFTSDVSVTATAEGSANTVVTATTLTFEAVPHLIEFFSPRIVAGAAALRIGLFEDGTNMGLISSMNASATVSGVHSCRHTPSAASHTYSIRAWNASAATATIGGGAGGTGTTLRPGFIRITRIPT